MQYLHSMVKVRDLEESLTFYCDRLGLVEVDRSEYGKGRFTLVFLATSTKNKQLCQMIYLVQHKVYIQFLQNRVKVWQRYKLILANLNRKLMA